MNRIISFFSYSIIFVFLLIFTLEGQHIRSNNAEVSQNRETRLHSCAQLAKQPVWTLYSGGSTPMHCVFEQKEHHTTYICPATSLCPSRIPHGPPFCLLCRSPDLSSGSESAATGTARFLKRLPLHPRLPLGALGPSV